jgi:hypothetical protein
MNKIARTVPAIALVSLIIAVSQGLAQVPCEKNEQFLLDFETDCSGTWYRWSSIECEDGASYVRDVQIGSWDSC